LSLPLARRMARAAYGSLAARISFFVFAAALTSALAVAASSAIALRAFLRSKVEQKIPAEVTQLRDHLALWYGQRRLDVQVFARSRIVGEGLAEVARGGARAARAREDVGRYLDYVLSEFSQYVSLFALDAKGQMLLVAGADPGLAPAALGRLVTVDDVEVSDLLAGRDGAVQVVSSAVRGGITLHAVLPVQHLAAELAAGSKAERVFVYDARGGAVAAADGHLPGAGAPAPPVLRAEPGSVQDYVAPGGLRVVGSALPFDPFGWTLVVEEDYEHAFAPLASILRRTVVSNLAIVAVLSAVAFAFATTLVRPLHALSSCAQRLRDGELDVHLPVIDRADEVGVLARSFNEMVHGVRDAHAALEQLAITDGLTKLHNHRFFQDQLGREIKRSERTGTPVSLVLVDIDDFKNLNDRCGHAAGDAVLQGLAAILEGETRDHDLVARYGGEEFAVLAPGTDLEGGVAIAEKIRLGVAATRFNVPNVPGGLGVTVSVGVAQYRGDRERFFHEADQALYAAKHAGKDCVVAG
jgi:diguanylate cyclase (GGDEF)-like protein